MRKHARSDQTLEGAAAPWWRGAVLYQVYSRSFLDTNGDGVGDLPGIIDRLDYVAALGVDGVWLSPFFQSPMDDFGYDVSDYRAVDPVFGTLSDFDRLVAKAHALGLKVIIDQVYSHTSDRHAWFEESRRDRTNPKADWYVWADPKKDGTPPNNWLSVFGGGAWRWDNRRGQYYFHNFLASQPDLNLHNKAVQDALLEVARFWLDRDVDGFRLDALDFAMHEPQLRDNPAATSSAKNFRKPFDYQRHIYNKSHPGIPAFLERLRSLTDRYDGVFTVAEVAGGDPLPEMRAFTAGDARLNAAYNFDFLYADQLTPGLIKTALSAWPGEKDEGWPSWAFSNHDAPRAVSRWRGEAPLLNAAKLYVMLLLSLRGNIFLYQGEELGLPQPALDFEDLKDPEAITNWPLTLGRDGARTPLPWTSAAANAGFTTGAPWLPVSPAHRARAVDAQEPDQQSMLQFTRRLIALRKSSPALRIGALAFLSAPDDLIVFERRHRVETILCAFNLGSMAQKIEHPGIGDFELVASTAADAAGAGAPSELPPTSGFIARASHRRD